MQRRQTSIHDHLPRVPSRRGPSQRNLLGSLDPGHKPVEAGHHKSGVQRRRETEILETAPSTQASIAVSPDLAHSSSCPHSLLLQRSHPLVSTLLHQLFNIRSKCQCILRAGRRKRKLDQAQSHHRQTTNGATSRPTLPVMMPTWLSRRVKIATAWAVKHSGLN